MKQLPWDNNPEIIATIFLHIVAHYWKAEKNSDYYRTNFFPRHVSDVILTSDHSLHNKPRLYLYEIKEKEHVGIWDESIYHVNFAKQTKTCWNYDNGQHDFQLFLRSFLASIQPFTPYYPILKDLFTIVSHFPLLGWKCAVCRNWSKTFSYQGNEMIVRCLLTFRNKKTTQTISQEQLPHFVQIMEKLLARFLSEFKKICEQTSADPIVIMENLIEIVEKYTEQYSIDQMDEFDNLCAKDMKNYLYREFKFFQTKNIHMDHLVRDMILSRDIFSMLTTQWAEHPSSLSSAGILMMLCLSHFRDAVLDEEFLNTEPHVVIVSQSIRRPMTEQEKMDLVHYHPLLRHALFVE